MAIDRSGILNRVKNIFKGLPQTKIAKVCGVTHQAVNRYFRKDILPNYDAMLRIAKYANVSMEWLLTGKGPKEPPATGVREAKALYEVDATINIITPEEYKKLLPHIRSGRTFFIIPIISEPIFAGDPLVINAKDIEGFVGIHKTWIKRGHTYRCLRVRGNCMHPIINDGFIVAIDLNENDPLKLERQIVAARYKDGVALRYLILAEKDYVLSPHNITRYKSIVMPRTAPNPIIGKVAWWWGKQK